MADFDARINLEVTSNKALNTVNKVEAALDKLNQTAREFGEAFLGQTERRGAFAVAQAQKLAGAIRSGAQEAAKFNAELERTARLAANIRGNRALPPARNAGALPAAGGTSRESIQFRDAIRLAEEIDKNYTEAYRQLLKPAEDFRRFASQISGALNQKLLPAATSGTGQVTRGNNNQTYAPVSGNSRTQQARLQKEVDRQIVELGKLTKETEELVKSYNRRQKSSDRLVKTEGRLSTEISKEAAEYGKSKPGSGSSGGFNGLQQAALGVGFPLLFGGGPGSILGGGLGALGGFGGSVLGSAIGGQIDALSQSASELGLALRPLTADFEKLATAVGQSQNGLSQQLQAVANLAGETTALRLAQEQLAITIGQDGVAAIESITDSQIRANDELAKAFLGLQVAMAPILTGILDFVSRGAERARLFGRATGDLRNEEGVSQAVQDFGNTRFNPFGGTGVQDAAENVLEIIRDIEKEERAVANARLQSAAGAQELLAIKQNELTLSELGSDLTNQEVFSLSEKIIKQKASVEEQKLYLQFAQDEITIAVLRNGLTANDLEMKKQLNDLANRRAKLEQAAADADARRQAAADRAAEAERKREQALQKRIQLTDFNNATTETSLLKQNQLQDQINQAKIEGNSYDVIELQYQQKLTQLTEQRLKALANARPENTARINSLFDARESIAKDDRDRAIATRSSTNDKETTRAVEDLALRTKGVLALTEAEQLLVQREQALLDVERQRTEIGDLNADNLRDATNKYFDAAEAAQRYQEVLGKTKEVAGSLSSSVLNGIRSVVEGTKTAEEAFASFLDTIVDLLLKAAAEQIATYIAIGIARQFAGMGGGDSIGDLQSGTAKNPVQSAANLYKKEVGGRTMANMPYVVGEKGPELFVPGKTGTVIPADVFDATRAAIKGGEASGGDSDAFEQNSVALGNSASITKENSLVREMGMRENEPIDVRYDSTVINNVEYVTADQFQKGISDSVKQSRASVYKELRNKPAARSGVGI